jgi:mRNA interferase YafQ
MLLVTKTSSYRKAYKKLSKSGRFPFDEFRSVLVTLAVFGKLDARYKDHPLHGKFIGHRECHIKADLLLVYRIENNKLVLVEVGNHSEVFE